MTKEDRIHLEITWFRFSPKENLRVFLTKGEYQELYNYLDKNSTMKEHSNAITFLISNFLSTKIDRFRQLQSSYVGNYQFFIPEAKELFIGYSCFVKREGKDWEEGIIGDRFTMNEALDLLWRGNLKTEVFNINYLLNYNWKIEGTNGDDFPSEVLFFYDKYRINIHEYHCPFTYITLSERWKDSTTNTYMNKTITLYRGTIKSSNELNKILPENYWKGKIKN